MVTLTTVVVFGLTAYPITLTAERLPLGRVEVVLPPFADQKTEENKTRELRSALARALRVALVPGVDLYGARVVVEPSPVLFWQVPRAALVAVALAAIGGVTAPLPVVYADVPYEDGGVGAVRGVFSALRSLAPGSRVIVARENAPEASFAHMAGGPDLEIRAVHNLHQLRALIRGEDVEGTRVEPATWTASPPLVVASDAIAEAYRPLVVETTAPATLWVTGRKVPVVVLGAMVKALLPPLTELEAAELTAVYSSSGMLPGQEGVIRSRPYRAPHHTTSADGFVGRADPLAPGEVSFAHGGILMLDEVTELPVATRAKIRRVLAAGQRVCVSGGRRTAFPARPRLVIARAFSCPCGAQRTCVCTPDQISRHLTDARDFAADVATLTP